MVNKKFFVFVIALILVSQTLIIAATYAKPIHRGIIPKAIIDHFEPKLLSKAKPANPGNGNGKPSGGSSTSGGSEITGQKYAVVIGISDYEGTDNDLQYADDDAKDWANYLQSIGYQVKLLLDRDATADAIEAAINWLISVVDEPGDAVVFAYSGHGYYDPKYGSMIISTDMVGITQGYFDEAFSHLVSQHAFFFFDACQIGGMKVLADTEVGRYVAMASNEHSYSYDGTEDMQNGFFTYYFLEDAILTKGYKYMEDAFAYTVSVLKDILPQMKPTDADTYDGGLALT